VSAWAGGIAALPAPRGCRPCGQCVSRMEQFTTHRSGRPPWRPAYSLRVHRPPGAAAATPLREMLQTPPRRATRTPARPSTGRGRGTRGSKRGLCVSGSGSREPPSSKNAAQSFSLSSQRSAGLNRYHFAHSASTSSRGWSMPTRWPTPVGRLPGGHHSGTWSDWGLAGGWGLTAVPASGTPCRRKM